MLISCSTYETQLSGEKPQKRDAFVNLCYTFNLMFYVCLGPC
uniref:Uncharacterized protein n=1 Tax=Arundo donax TaxID=35708 RepID=A0A0A9FC71_ARUDO